MAHGLPDYYRGVDIAYQALSELINRPKYGAAQSVRGSTACGPNNTKTLFTVSGKGIIYGGVLYYYPTSSQYNGRFIYKIDGQTIVDEWAWVLNNFGIKDPLCHPMVVLLFDNVNFDYCFGLAYGYTFESSFSMQYQETNGGAFVLYHRIAFALI